MDDQLKRIFKLLGAPTEETWPAVTQLPDYKPILVHHNTQVNWVQVVSKLNSKGRDLLAHLLVPNPNHRLTADTCLMHAYFNDVDPIVRAWYEE